MAAGDHTVGGPYNTDSTGVAAAALAMNDAFDGIDDKYVIVPSANGLEFWFIHIEGQ